MGNKLKDTPYGLMSFELEEFRLEDICVPEDGIQTGPFGSQLHNSDYVADGTPIITVEHLGENRITRQNLPRVSDEDRARLSRYSMRAGDIIFSRVGSVDRRAIVREQEDGWLFSGRCLRVRPNPKMVSPEYLSWFMGLVGFKEYIRKIAVGATMPSLNTKLLADVPIFLPSLEKQRKSAMVLDSLDNKIELNRRTSATLESMARTLFKSWFIDFEPVRAKAAGKKTGLPKEIEKLFPSRLVKTELGEVPESWEMLSVYSLAQFINGASYKSFQPNELRLGTPIVKITELKLGVTDQTKFSQLKMPSKYLINYGDILFSWSGNPDTSIDTFVWEGDSAWLNQHIFKVVAKSFERSMVLCLLRYLRPVFAELARNKQTTGLGHVTAKDLKDIMVPWPNKPTIDLWENLVGPLMDRQLKYGREIRSLQVLRDGLIRELIQ